MGVMAEFMFHEFRLDITGSQLWRGADRIALPPKPFAVLCLLIERAGELVTKGDLLDVVWSRRHVSESSISVAINALRAALGDDPKMPRYIETVNRLGFRFIALVTKAAEKTANQNDTSAPSASEASIGLPLRLRPRHGFFGRTCEQTTMAQRWEAAKQGERQLIMIAGEPGIGKTRLAVEAARRAHDDGAVVLFGSCDADIGLPYRPFVEALRHYVRNVRKVRNEVLVGYLDGHRSDLVRLFPELTTGAADFPKVQVADSETERYLMFEAVVELLAEMSKHHPVMLILDDLQWARVPDLLLLKHIMRSAVPMSVMIVVVFRDNELAGTHPLVPLLAGLRHETRIERIALRGLDEQGVVALVADVVGRALDPAELMLARTIHRDTEGNPFFAREILHELQKTGAVIGAAHDSSASCPATVLCLPESVKEVLGQWVSRLSSKTQRLLGMASVIGQQFDVALLAKVAGQSDDEVLDGLDEAMIAALVVEVVGEQDRFAFTHALMRATLYNALSAARRATIHRRIGEGLEAPRLSWQACR